MEFFRATSIDFLGRRRYAYAFTILLTLGTAVCLASKGLNFGIDFTGGTLIELGYERDVALDKVRGELAAAGFKDALVQNFGSPRDVLVRLAPQAEESSAAISNRVLEALPGAQMRRVEFVGPQIGDELAEQGGLAMLYALIGILIYVAIRFEWRFAVGAVIATIHDAVIVFGALSLTQLTFDLTALAAVLAVIGYSLNDTIVVFDRIRENFRKMRKGTPEEVANASINQTLSRTIMTSVATLLVVVALFVYGGEVLRPFSAALIVGILIGTFSSIYVASALTIALGISRGDMLPVAREGAPADQRP
ncbi:MAG: protein translocase subunit SecF [Gammaproteobacteria bacterium]|nr:protein translocase subunit SecF [Gammaproteobacteria bacterium]